MPDDIRTYEILTKDGEYELEVPADYKITYAPIQPGRFDHSTGNVLRIYENENKQRAMFTNVITFRDKSMPLRKKIKITKQKARDKNDNRGNRESERDVEVEEKWEAQ